MRWLIIYESLKGEAVGKVIDDAEFIFPFGVDESDVADDCWRIIAIVHLPDDWSPEVVVVKDRAVTVWQLP